MKSNLKPVSSPQDLQRRVAKFFSSSYCRTNKVKQRNLFVPKQDFFDSQSNPTSSVESFLDYLVAALPSSDIYLFGGLLRDFALFGKDGFKSDVDVVVDGEMGGIVNYLVELGAKKNKFGGYRLLIKSREIDLWKAEETWAVRKNLVVYKGIASLLESTVINWDAVLMNWRTGKVICSSKYIQDIRNGHMDLVLKENPDSLSALVKILRYISLKETKSVSSDLLDYLTDIVGNFSKEIIKNKEFKSFKSNYIDDVLLNNLNKVSRDKRSGSNLSEDIYIGQLF